MRFVNRRTNGNAVRRAGARQDQLVDADLQHFLKQDQRPKTVISVVEFRALDGLGDIGVSGEMCHHIRPILVQRCCHRCGVANIALDKRPPFNRVAPATREVVIRNDRPTGFGECLATV